MSISWFRFPWPKAVAAGVSTTIRVRDTETSCASTYGTDAVPFPNWTWTGASKPSPLMTTSVPPSFGPVAGVTEKMVGCRMPPPPPLV